MLGTTGTKHPPTWRIITGLVSGDRIAPDLQPLWKAIWKGSHNPTKGTNPITMVINHLRPSWNDPASTPAIPKLGSSSQICDFVGGKLGMINLNVDAILGNIPPYKTTFLGFSQPTEKGCYITCQLYVVWFLERVVGIIWSPIESNIHLTANWVMICYLSPFIRNWKICFS